MCTKFMVLGHCPTPCVGMRPSRVWNMGCHLVAWLPEWLSRLLFAARRLFVLSYSCASSRRTLSLSACSIGGAWVGGLALLIVCCRQVCCAGPVHVAVLLPVFAGDTACCSQQQECPQCHALASTPGDKSSAWFHRSRVLYGMLLALCWYQLAWLCLQSKSLVTAHTTCSVLSSFILQRHASVASVCL